MSDNKEFIEKVSGWREKAKTQDDVFLKFAIEYFAFNALLKRKFSPGVYQNDRKLIELLKKDGGKSCKEYCVLHAKEWINKLVRELEKTPLKKLTRDTETEVSIEDVNDWKNIVEVTYCIRNNLFHGDKSPDVERDQRLVEHGYGVLSCMNEDLSK